MDSLKVSWVLCPDQTPVQGGVAEIGLEFKRVYFGGDKTSDMTGTNHHVAAMREKIAEMLKECQGISGLESFTSKPSEVTIEDDPLFLTGYSSVIVRVRAADGSTVIAKHAPPYLRAFGEGSPISQVRSEMEMTGLQLFQKYSPGSCPEFYFYSSKHNTVLMEDLAGYTSLHSDMIAGNVSRVAMGTLAAQIAKIHRSTHKDNISDQEWAKLQDLLKKSQPVIEQLGHAAKSYTYINNPPDEVAKQLKEIAERCLFGNSKLNQLVDTTMADYIHSKESLVCGGQTRNILVKGDHVKMVDHEFARLGRCTCDVGLMFGGMIVTYCYHLVSTEDSDSHRQMAHKIRKCTHHFVDTYIEHMSWPEGDKVQHVNTFLTELARFAGFGLLFQIGFGICQFLGPSQIQLLEASIRLMEQHQLADSVDKLYSTLGLE